MGEVYAWQSGDAPALIAEFTGIPLSGIRGSPADCILLNTAAGETLFHGDGSSNLSAPSSAVPAGTVVSASVGKEHFVAVTDAGIVFTQGGGEVGQTGQGHTDALDSPYPLKIACQIADVCSGQRHCVARSGGGRVYTWGDGYFGQHGGTVRRPQMVPRQLSFQKCVIAQIATGDAFSLALARDGRLWSWGANDCGQLGLGDTKARFKPQVIGSAEAAEWDRDTLRTNVSLASKANKAVQGTFASIGAGKAHSVACDKDGRLFAWGFNMQGQLGQGESRKFSTVPLGVQLNKQQASGEDGEAKSTEDHVEQKVEEPLLDESQRIVEVGAAAYYSAARSANGCIYTFGKFVTTGDDQPRLENAGTPALVQKLSDAKLRITRLACCAGRIAVYAAPIFLSMSFNCSPFHGGTELRLKGTSFFASDLIRVRFSPTAEGLDPIIVGASFEPSTGDIICTTPPLEETHAHYIPNEEEFNRKLEEAAQAKAEAEKEERKKKKKKKQQVVELPDDDESKAGDAEEDEEIPVFDPNLHTIVDISLDGGITYSKESHAFMFYNNPTFTEVSPTVVGNGGRGSTFSFTGEGLFRLPEATGEQRSVVGVRLNIFEAKDTDAKGPRTKKKKAVKSKGPTVWDPIERTILCEASLEVDEDEDTGEPLYSVICDVPDLSDLAFPKGPLRRAMVEVSMNNSDYPDKEDYRPGLPIECFIFDNSVRPLQNDSQQNSVCVRRTGQDRSRTTESIRVEFAAPLPAAAGIASDGVSAKLDVNGEVYEVESDAARLVDGDSGYEGVDVRLPENLLIPDGTTTAQLTVSVNYGDEFSNPVPVNLYAGQCGEVTAQLNATQSEGNNNSESGRPPAFISEEGGVPVAIFPAKADGNWLLEGAQPTVEFIEPDGTVLATVSKAEVDVKQGCVVVVAPALPQMATPKWDTTEAGTKAVAVRVAVNGTDFLDSADNTNAAFCVQYYGKAIASEAVIIQGPDPVETARLAEEAAKAAAAAAADEAAAAEAPPAKPAKGKGKSKGKAKPKSAKEEPQEPAVPIIPIAVRLEGDRLAPKGTPETGGGIVVRFTRVFDNKQVELPGKVVDLDIVECDPPHFGEIGEPTESAKVDPKDTTAQISVNGGLQYSDPVEVTVQEYEPDE